MLKLTPKYGIYKQLEYRDEVFKKIKARYEKNSYFSIVSLGGRFCLVNKQSIENQILKHYKHCRIIIVEKNEQSIRLLNKSNKDHRVEIYKGTIRKYFLDEDETKFDVLIADYYSGFNKERIEEVKILFSENLLNKNSQVFLTIAESYRASTQPINEYVKSESNSNNYKEGSINIIEKIAKSNKVKLENQIESWSYKNKDLSKHATLMHVLDIKVA